MNSILAELYYMFCTPSENAELEQLVEDNHRRLIDALEKPERRLVLQIIDAKDQIKETATVDSFVAGFKLACRLCNELFCVEEHSLD